MPWWIWLIIVTVGSWFVGMLMGYTVGYDNGRINENRKLLGLKEIDAWHTKKYQ